MSTFLKKIHNDNIKLVSIETRPIQASLFFTKAEKTEKTWDQYLMRLGNKWAKRRTVKKRLYFKDS